MKGLIDRYASGGNGDGPLPARLTIAEIAALAYPDDQESAFRFSIALARAIESGELRVSGTIVEKYLSAIESSRRVERHVVDRADFAAFLRVQNVEAEGRLAEWTANVTGAHIEAGTPGHPEVNNDAILFVVDLERTGRATSRMDACRQAVARYFKGHPNPESKAKSIAASIRNRRQP